MNTVDVSKALVVLEMKLVEISKLDSLDTLDELDALPFEVDVLESANALEEFSRFKDTSALKDIAALIETSTPKEISALEENLVLEGKPTPEEDSPLEDTTLEVLTSGTIESTDEVEVLLALTVSIAEETMLRDGVVLVE